MGLKLRWHDTNISRCKLEFSAQAPVDVLAKPLTFYARSKDESSLVCPTEVVPKNALDVDSDWNALEFVGPFDPALTGILAQVAVPMAATGVSIIALATFDTDYVLIKIADREKAAAALRKAGHTFV